MPAWALPPFTGRRAGAAPRPSGARCEKSHSHSHWLWVRTAACHGGDMAAASPLLCAAHAPPPLHRAFTLPFQLPLHRGQRERSGGKIWAFGRSSPPIYPRADPSAGRPPPRAAAAHSILPLALCRRTGHPTAEELDAQDADGVDMEGGFSKEEAIAKYSELPRPCGSRGSTGGSTVPMTSGSGGSGGAGGIGGPRAPAPVVLLSKVFDCSCYMQDSITKCDFGPEPNL